MITGTSNPSDRLTRSTTIDGTWAASRRRLQRTHWRPRLRDGKANRSDRNDPRHGRLVSHESARHVDTFARLRWLSHCTRFYVRRHRPRLSVPERAAVPIPLHRWARSPREPMSARSGTVPGQVPENPLATGQSEIVSGTPVAAAPCRSRWGEYRPRRGQAKIDVNGPEADITFARRTPGRGQFSPI